MHARLGGLAFIRGEVTKKLLRVFLRTEKNKNKMESSLGMIIHTKYFVYVYIYSMIVVLIALCTT